MTDRTLAVLPLSTTLTPPISPQIPPSLASRSSMPGITIVTPSPGPSEPSPLSPNPSVDFTDPQNLQYQIYLELRKLNTNAKMRNNISNTSLYASSPYISRRNAFWTSTQPTRAHNDPTVTFEGAEFDALGQQFTTLVIISTFTANLIIAFLTLAHGIISGRQDVPTYSTIVEVGQFLALVGMATHAGVIIIAGRCAALALKHAKSFTGQPNMNDDEQKDEDELCEVEYKVPDDSDTKRHPESPDHLTSQSKGTEERPPTITTTPNITKPRSGPSTLNTKEPSFPNLGSFCRFLAVCETLQLFGTAIFFLGVTVLIFLIFLHLMFPIMLTGGFVIGACGLSWVIGFWEISASKQLVRGVKTVWTQRMSRMGTCVWRSGRSLRKKTDADEVDLEKGRAN